MFEVSGRVAFVTGAASGIGRGMALALAEAGADVLLADVDVAGLDAVRDAIIGKGSGRAVTARLDVRDPDAWRSAADAAEAEFGKINILCSNAGVAAGNAPIEERTLADVDRLWDINARAMFIGVREILPRIRSHGEGGHIVITSSVAGTLAAPGILPYTMSKYAASALGETLYLELKGTNIGVSILCPGKVDTAIIANISRPTSSADAKGGAPTPSPLAGSASPLDIGTCVVEAIRDRRFYIFTHPEYRDVLKERFDVIQSCFGGAATEGAVDNLSYYQVGYRS